MANPLPVPDVTLGIMCGLCGSICINLGNNIQSVGLLQLQRKDQERRRADQEAAGRKRGTSLDRQTSTWEEVTSSTKKVKTPLPSSISSGSSTGDSSVGESAEPPSNCDSPVFVGGTIIFITGSILNFAAFAFAPQSILAALEGIQVGFSFPTQN